MAATARPGVGGALAAAEREKQRRAQQAQLKFEVTPLIRAIATDEAAFDRMLAPLLRLAEATGFDAPLLCLLRERDGKGRLPAEWARMTRQDAVAEVSAARDFSALPPALGDLAARAASATAVRPEAGGWAPPSPAQPQHTLPG